MELQEGIEGGTLHTFVVRVDPGTQAAIHHAAECSSSAAAPGTVAPVSSTSSTGAQAVRARTPPTSRVAPGTQEATHHAGGGADSWAACVSRR
eukprot:COSAG01_NODE_3605_length_5879_cov_3.169377_2_plen_93_part_00